MFTTTLDGPTCYFLYYHVTMEAVCGWRQTPNPTASKISGDNYRIGGGDVAVCMSYNLEFLVPSILGCN